MTLPSCIDYWSAFGRMKALPQDASPRRYFRLHSEDRTYIIADASAEPELFDRCMKQYTYFESAGLRIPHVDLWHRPSLSWRMEDLGATHLMDLPKRFSEGFDLVAELQQASPPADLEDFQTQKIQHTKEIFETYYMGSASQAQQTHYAHRHQDIWDSLVDIQTSIPQVWCHGDMHTQNIMQHPSNGRLYLIDYQDSILGPMTLDYVSLIDDVRLPWHPYTRELWMQHCSTILATQYGTDMSRIHLWLEATTLFRLLRILGVFERLAQRDFKYNYLRYIPNIERRIIHILLDLPDWAPIRDWVKR